MLSRIWAWIKCHRQRSLGFAAMFVAALQMNFEYLLQLIPEHYRPFILFSFGMLAAIFGWLNTIQYDPERL